MSPIYKGLVLAAGLIFTACLHEKNQPYCQLGLASFRKLLHLMAFVQLIIFIMASKIIVCRLNFGIKTKGEKSF
jgi:hypothetical protein